MENNGRGIFYGVIGVATLVVAIIGATFAFFAAATETNEFTATSADVKNLELSEPDENGLRTALVPIDADGTYYEGYHTKFGAAAGIGDDKCIDDVGNSICSIYQFTVTNPNNIPQKIYFYLNQKENTFENLYYAIFAGAPTNFTVYKSAGVAADETEVVAARNTTNLVVAPTKLNSTDKGKNLLINQLTQDLPANGSVTYSVIVWLEEIGAEQAGDLNKAFTAAINVNTAVLDADGNATGGVTGVLAG